MTKLLVSVRNTTEAQAALAGGANVIDVKEPQFGSLGMASSATHAAVKKAVATWQENEPNVSAATRLSAAMGELLDESWQSQLEVLVGYSYAKIGLAGCTANADWEMLWRKWIDSLPEGTAPVAVLYADYQKVGAPSPRELIRAASSAAVRTLLIDTHEKKWGDTLDQLGCAELGTVVRRAQDAGFLIALAGSVTLERLPEYLHFRPDWIAVRGAVCVAGRESRIDREMVERFAMRLSTPCHMNASPMAVQAVDGASRGA